MTLNIFTECMTLIFVDFCYVKEDVQHYLMDCIDFMEFQEILVKCMRELNVTVTLKNVLSNPLLYKVLWDYIQSTEKSL